MMINPDHTPTPPPFSEEEWAALHQTIIYARHHADDLHDVGVEVKDDDLCEIAEMIHLDADVAYEALTRVCGEEYLDSLNPESNET